HVTRPGPLAGIAVEGELADAEDLALRAQRLVHPPLGVVEDPQRQHLLGQPVALFLGVPHADPEQHHHPRLDLRHPRPLDVDRRLTAPLDQRPHGAQSRAGRRRSGPGEYLPALMDSHTNLQLERPRSAWELLGVTLELYG